MNSNINSLPSFVVIGAMKCGTTSLWHYLRQHPEIYVPESIKNIEFFISNENWDKGLDWYESFFKFKNEKIKTVVEISTEYTKYPHNKDVAKNMYQVLPVAKLIYLIRNPIERLISHYIHMVGASKEDRELDEIISKDKNNEYILYSLYYYQLQQFVDFYPKEKILIITTEELKNSKDNTLKKIFEFIDVDPQFTIKENISLNKREERKKWNIIGKKIRRSPKYYNYYKYYLSKAPYLLEKYIDFLFCKPIENPVINASNYRYLTETFNEDISNLKKYSDLVFHEWKI